MKNRTSLFITTAISFLSLFSLQTSNRAENSPSSLINITPSAENRFSIDTQNHHLHPVTITIKNPTPSHSFKIKIDTPPRNIWFSTDFPIVEGKPLLELDTNSQQVTFQQLFPIRGNYQLTLKSSNNSLSNNFPIFIKENPKKYYYFFILIVILTAVGFVGGWVIGQKQQPSKEAVISEKAGLVFNCLIFTAIVALLYINISAELTKPADSHGVEDHQVLPSVKTVPDDSIAVQFLGDSQATVGEMANLKVQLMNPKTQKPLINYPVTVSTFQNEHQWLTFSYQTLTNSNGEIHWRQQFFDGSSHQLVVKAVSPNQQKLLTFSQRIAVRGIEPPLNSRLITLGYWMAILSLGFVLGWKGVNRKTQKIDLTLT